LIRCVLALIQTLNWLFYAFLCVIREIEIWLRRWRETDQRAELRRAFAVTSARSSGIPMPCTQQEVDHLLDASEIDHPPDLHGKNLTGLDLRRKCLYGANLKNATLTQACLDGALLACADLSGATLNGASLVEASLTQAILCDSHLSEANLHKARLLNARLWCAHLEVANLSEVEAIGAQFVNSKLQNADLRDARLAQANLQEADLRYADLTGANLHSAILHHTVLDHANLDSAVFRYADLRHASLQSTDLGGLDLRDIAEPGLQHTRLFRARFDRTLLTLDQIRPAVREETEQQYDRAQEVYRTLKQNFQSLGDYDAAAWCYIKERRMEKACNSPWRARRFYGDAELGDKVDAAVPWYHPKVWYFYIKHTIKWLVDWAQELLCGYGERPWNTVVAIAAVFLAFIGIYWATWGVFKVESEPGREIMHSTRNLMDLAIFSFAALTTMGTDGLRPAAPWVQLAMAAEALCGIGLTGLLGFVIGNRIRRP